jgi:hypothetical protein
MFRTRKKCRPEKKKFIQRAAEMLLDDLMWFIQLCSNITNQTQNMAVTQNNIFSLLLYSICCMFRYKVSIINHTYNLKF